MSGPFIKVSSPTEKMRNTIRADVLDDSLESLDMEKFSVSPTKRISQRDDPKRSEGYIEPISGLDAVGAQFSGSGSWGRAEFGDRKSTLAPIVRPRDSRFGSSSVRYKISAEVIDNNIITAQIGETLSGRNIHASVSSCLVLSAVTILCIIVLFIIVDSCLSRWTQLFGYFRSFC